VASKKRPKRRRPNSGTIRYKPGRERPWEAAFPLGHGEYRYDSFSTRSDAAAFLDRLTAERARATAPRNIPGGSQRVDTFLIAWLTMKQAHVKPNTLQSYQYLCELASGQLGGLRLDQVDRQRADGLIAYFHRRKFKAVGQLRAVLRQAFEYALDEDYIARNPFQRVKTPPVEHRHGIALSKEQRAQLLDAATIEDNPDVPLRPLWHLYARLGLRRGEGMGLRRGDIDWSAKTITIAQQYVSHGGKTVLSTPKTRRSRRTIPVPDDILQLLHNLLAAQVRRAADDPRWVVSGLVFCNAHGGNVTVGHVRYRWEQLRARAGIPAQMTIHDLRRTALTILELGGTPRNVVQAIAGHSSATQTAAYTDHAGIEDMRQALGT
jgi:integrase